MRPRLAVGLPPGLELDGRLRRVVPDRAGRAASDGRIRSGNWSGPPGSTRGQQPFRDGLVVQEVQEPCAGCTPRLGRIEVECAARIGPDAMFSAWLIEDEPERCGELCIVEVFGDARHRRAGRSRQSPRSPMQLELAVFEFPAHGGHCSVPELTVRRVTSS